MIELALVMMAGEEMLAESRRQQEKEWNERFLAASPELRRIMLDVKRESEKEAKIERRHREQISAQKEIADAIRYAARPRYDRYF